MKNEFKIKSFHNGEFVNLLETIKNKKDVIYRVGCDSLNVKDQTLFITTLVGIHPNKQGAFILYQKEKMKKVDDTTKRLWMEVERAISFASHLRDEYGLKIECIDFDLNNNQEYISSRLVTAAIGYAQSLGFIAYCKPNLIHAIYAADFIVHRKHALKY